ncbi:MAG: prepilin-type N-terminal cleavage/methylation domain-containing protein [Candidatus Acidiferrales bacterium]
MRHQNQFDSRQGIAQLPGRRSNELGFTLIELLIVVAIILVIAAIAIPNFLRSRMAANQAAAVASVRTITTASVVYNSMWNNGYPPTLASLGGPSSAVASCDQAILLDEIITTPPNAKSGYTFAYTGEDGAMPTQPANCGSPGFNGYLVTAVPEILGQTGTNSYCSYTPGVIHFDVTGSPATSETTCDALPTLQ